MNLLSSLLSAFRTDKGLKGQLLRGGVGSLAVKLGSTLLNVVLAVVLARTLGAEGFGIYSFVFALITILAIPAQMGLPNLVVRETAKAQANGDWALMKGLWRWSTLMALTMSLALMVVGGVAAWLFATRLPDGGLVVFYWGLVLVPLVALGNLRGAALRGLRHVVQGQLPEFILRPVFLIVLVLGAHFGLSARALDASDAMMLHALASLIAFVIGAWLLLRARPAPMHSEPHSKSLPRAWLKSALPLGIVDGMQLINQNIGLIILGILASAEDVGFYRIALQGGMLVSLGLMAINMVVGPYIARLHEQENTLALQRLLTSSARIALLLSVVSGFGLIIAGPALLTTLFGPEYQDSYAPLVIIALAQIINSITGCVGQILYMTRHELDVAEAVTIGAVCNALLALVLTPKFGTSGAALALIASVTIWNTMLVARVWQRTGLVAVAFWSTREHKTI